MFVCWCWLDVCLVGWVVWVLIAWCCLLFFAAAAVVVIVYLVRCFYVSFCCCFLGCPSTFNVMLRVFVFLSCFYFSRDKNTKQATPPTTNVKIYKNKTKKKQKRKKTTTTNIPIHKNNTTTPSNQPNSQPSHTPFLSNEMISL